MGILGWVGAGGGVMLASTAVLQYHAAAEAVGAQALHSRITECWCSSMVQLCM